MSYQALSPPFATCMPPPVFPQNHHGSKLFDESTTALDPSSTEKNVAKYFPESEETQMGHMQGQRQGVRSTHPIDAPGTTNDANPPNITVPVSNPMPTAHIVAHDILISVIDLKDTIYTDQMGCFPFVSSLGNRCIMILHHVDSNSSWSKALKYNTKDKLILARRRTLAQMVQRGIVSQHQILNNQASFAYKTKIELTKMTYKLVPPNDHCCNLAKKAIQTFKDHMISMLSDARPPCPCIFGASFSPRSNVNCFSCPSQRPIPTFWPMHMCMSITITIATHLSP